VPVTAAVWPNGNAALCEVTRHRPRLVLGWVTVRGYTVLVLTNHWAIQATQPGMGNVY